MGLPRLTDSLFPVVPPAVVPGSQDELHPWVSLPQALGSTWDPGLLAVRVLKGLTS